MDKISIPEDDVVTLETVAPLIVGLRIVLVNVYAIADESGRWMLIDTGLPHSQARIRRWAEEHFGRGARPTGILLTHGHFDHAGSVKALAEDWEVPVYIHPLEEQYVTGEVAYPPPDPTVGGGLMSLLSKLYPRGPVLHVDVLLPMNDLVPLDHVVDGHRQRGCIILGDSCVSRTENVLDQVIIRSRQITPDERRRNRLVPLATLRALENLFDST